MDLSTRSRIFHLLLYLIINAFEKNNVSIFIRQKR